MRKVCIQNEAYPRRNFIFITKRFSDRPTMSSDYDQQKTISRNKLITRRPHKKSNKRYENALTENCDDIKLGEKESPTQMAVCNILQSSTEVFMKLMSMTIINY